MTQYDDIREVQNKGMQEEIARITEPCECGGAARLKRFGLYLVLLECPVCGFATDPQADRDKAVVQWNELAVHAE